MAAPQIVDPFLVNAAATQPVANVVDPFSSTYEKPKGAFMRGVNAAARGVVGTAEGTAALAADAVGAKSVRDAALAAAKAQNDAAGKDTMRVEDVNDVGSGFDFVKYALGYLATQLGVSAASGGLGRVLGGAGARAFGEAANVLAAKHAGTVAGLAGSSLMQEIGQIYPDAIESGVADPIQRSLVGGVIAAAADVAPELYVAKGLGLVGKAARRSGALKEAGKVAAGEGATELFQTYVERAAAGQPVTGPDAISDYVNSTVLGAFGGALGGGMAGAYNQTRNAVDGGAPNAAPAPQPAPAPAPASTTPPGFIAPDDARFTPPPPTPFEAFDGSGLRADPAPDQLAIVDPFHPTEAAVPDRAGLPFKTTEPEATVLGGDTPAPPAQSLITPRVEGFDRSATDLVRDNTIARDAAPVVPVEETPSGRTTTADERLTAQLTPAPEPVKAPPYSGPPVIIGGLEVHPEGTPQLIVPAAPAEPTPGFARSATDLIADRASPAPTLAVPASGGTPRQVIKTFDPRAAREQAVGTVENYVNQQVATLPFKSDKTAATVTAAIKRAADTAFQPGADGTVAKQAVLDQTRRVLKGKIPPEQIDAVAKGLDAQLGEVRLQSKDAVTPEAPITVKEYQGQTGDKRHITRVEQGNVPVADVAQYAGARGEARGEHRNRTGPAWDAFVADVKQNGVRDPILITKDYNGKPVVAEGNHRIDAAVAAGLKEIPATIRYFGNAQKQGLVLSENAYKAPSPHDPSILTSRDATQEQVDSMLQYQGEAAIRQVEAVLGTPDNLRVQTYLSDSGAGSITLGKLKDIIALNLNAKDVLSVANHEAYHYLEYRVLPKGDREIVERAFAPGGQMWNQLLEAVRRRDGANGTQIEAEVRGVPAEARAYAFQLWNTGELTAQGAVQRIFAALKRAVERISNWVSGSGFKSYEDIFDAAERGYYAKRYGSPFVVDRLEVPQALRLASQDSLREMAERARAGEITQVQLNARIAELLDDRELGDVRERFLDRARDETKGAAGGIKRAYLSNISSGENLARKSAGYKNVFNALTAFAQRKNRLIADGVEKQLSKWVKVANEGDKVAVSKALLERTVASVKVGSPQYDAIRGRLTPYQREMFDQANYMIASRLEDEFTADQGIYSRVLGAGSDNYKQWFANRRAQVDNLKANGYFPERRYGDHVTHVYINGSNGKRITLYYSQHEREAEARAEERDLKQALAQEPGLHVEYGYRYRADYDGSLSFQQFLDMAQRHGIGITQAEKERIAKALVSADSIRRSRIFRRKNIAGYSEDGMRVLAEFGVAMANKIAYHELGGAINDAIAGRAVNATFTRDGTVNVQTDPNTDLWAADGPMGGYFRNLSDQTADFVLSPRSGNRFSRALRGMASVQFLGGSIAAGMVQLTSMAMNTTPWLTQHTGYADALARSFAGYKTAMANHKSLTDLPTLLNESVKIPGVDEVEGLRHALQIAAQDGTTLDTEIYQIMGLSRGQEYSLSGRVQQFVKAWMTPFRITEQWNRAGTFIAAFKLAKDQNKTNEDAYKFAQETVYATQFRYDEANRPALARGDVGSLLFVFKSYPIFVLESMAHLAKVSPSSAVYMTLTLALMAGVEGMPFAEDIEDLIDTIGQRVFNSPFNTKRALRNVLKNASEAVVGADLSGVLLHGVANELTGMSFASRVGMGNLIPGTRLGTADADYKRTMSEILGPIGTIVQGTLSGADSLSKGHFVEAAQQALPMAAQNLIKGAQQWKQGYASDIGGRKLVDVSGWEAFWQSMGFSSAAVNRAYDADRMDRQDLAFYKQAEGEFMKNMVQAMQKGDSDKVHEITDAVVAWNRAHPDMPMILSPDAVRRRLQQAGLPINQRTMLTMPRTLRGSSEYVLGLHDR